MRGTTLVTIYAACIVSLTTAQQVGTSEPEVHPSLESQQCTSSDGCKAEQTKIVLDANWRWLHKVGGYTNCYTGNQWDTALCPDPETCAKNCALEGVKYADTYGITTGNTDLTLGFVTKHQYGTNVGSRVYLMQDDTKYKMFKLLNQEFTFDVDVSKLPCGLNGALYFVQMDQDGGMSKFPNNKAGAKYGTGYCDAQCPHDIKFINGEANVKGWVGTDANSGGGMYGSCCAEMDIWEANKMSTAFTSHPCTTNGQYRCSSPIECGDDASQNRYKGVCDKDGCDFNPFRMGNKTFYGPGSQFAIDSTKPFTVVTQFLTDDKTANGNLVEIKRFYKQNGRMIENSVANWSGVDPVASITDTMCAQTKTLFGDVNDHAAKGKLAQMGAALKHGVVLTMSIWADNVANLLWLDSISPPDKSPELPGVMRGTCPTTGGKPSELIQQVPGASVTFRNIRVGDIGSTTKA
jgi:cellulose 1,4-beta-cellobiosidase